MKWTKLTQVPRACLFDSVDVLLCHRGERQQRHFMAVFAEITEPPASMNVASISEVTNTHKRGERINRKQLAAEDDGARGQLHERVEQDRLPVPAAWCKNRQHARRPVCD